MASARVAFTPCPLTEQQIAACNIVAVTGASIPRINRYCIGNYASCPVYKAQRRPADVPEEPDAAAEGPRQP